MLNKVTFLFLLLTVIGYTQVWQLISTVPYHVNSIVPVNKNIIFICCNSGKVYRSVNGAFSWQDKSNGLPSDNCYGISAIDSLNCWVGSGESNGAIYRTTNGGTSWVQQINIPGSFINGIKMFNANYGWYFGDPTSSGQPYQFRYTTNGGINWILSPTAPIAVSEIGFINSWDFIDTNKIWVGSNNQTYGPTSSKIYCNTAGSWYSVIPADYGIHNWIFRWNCIAFTDTLRGMAGSNWGDMIKTSDGGVTWSPVPNPVSGSYYATSLNAIKDGSNIIRLSVYPVGYQMASFKTSNFGETWTTEALPNYTSYDQMQFITANLGFAIDGNQIFRYGPSIPVELTSFIAVTSPGKVNLNWKTATETNNRGFEIERKIDEGQFMLIAYKNGYGTTVVPKEYSYTDDITSINGESLTYRLKQLDLDGGSEYSNEVMVNNIIPVEYTLGQNFPNPFNPTTTIKFRIPESGFVSLKVYNSLGREAATLVNETKGAGTYEVQLNALNLTSGIYYYVLKVNEFVETKKMTLLK